MEIPRGARSLALLMSLAVSGPSCKEEEIPVPAPVDLAADFDARFAEMARVDMLDGSDDVDEETSYGSWQAYLTDLEARDPLAYDRFMLQLGAVLGKRGAMTSDDDVRAELEVFDLETFTTRLQNRNHMVGTDGIVHFPSEEAERNLTLGDLTLDSEIEFWPLNPKTMEKMGISYAGEPSALRCWRLTEDTGVMLGSRKITAPAGTFVISVSDGTLYRVLVYEGDRIVDSLSKDYSQAQTYQGETSSKFERSLKAEMPGFSLNSARHIFHRQFPTYKGLMTSDYRALLVKEGIPFEEHFVIYLKWCETQNLPVNEDSMRLFFELLLERKLGGKKKKVSQASSESQSLLDRALGLFGSGKKDEAEVLSYKDKKARDASREAEIILHEHGPLFAIVRLHGQFFDNYTYNRLAGNYVAKVYAAIAGGEECLVIEDIRDDLNMKSPMDILESADRDSTFVKRLNQTTTFTASDDAELREDLARSAGIHQGMSVSANDFEVSYGASGEVTAVSLRGKAYDPDTFYTSPGRLKGVPGDQVTLSFGEAGYTMNLQDFFDHYRELERDRRGVSQMVSVFDIANDVVISTRNVMWFVEDGGEPYEQVAKAVTRGSKSDADRLRGLAAWGQVFFDYIDEVGEVNKIAMATHMDGGGDCEDLVSNFITLARSIGLGDHVGIVVYSDHVQALVRGDYGGKTFSIDGDTWTALEMAVPKGETVAIGESTRKDDPLYYMMPDGSMVAASPNYIPMRTVPHGDLDRALVEAFEQNAEAVKAYIADPANQATQENFDRREEVIQRASELIKGLSASYKAIARTGEMSGVVSRKYESVIGELKAFDAAWRGLQRDIAAEMRRLELRDAPGQYREAWAEYQRLDEHLIKNLKPTVDKLVAVVERCDGHYEDYQYMMDAHDEMIRIINRSEVSLDIDRMTNLYRETLQYWPDGGGDQIRTHLEKRYAIRNEVIYGPLNIVIGVLQVHEEAGAGR